MMIILLILTLTFININAEENDNKFIETLPPEVKKGFLDKVSRRIFEEVPEVDTGVGATDGEVIDAKLEEQSEFVQKILREEIDSLKARRKNDDDKLDITETENKTVERSGDKVEHIDLTLRTHSKRADQVNKTEVDIIDKKELSEGNIKSKDKVENDTKNEHGEVAFQTEDKSKEVASKQGNIKVNIPNNDKAVLKNTDDKVSSPNLESKIINIVQMEKSKILQDEGIQVASPNSNEININNGKKVLAPNSDRSDKINWIKNENSKILQKRDTKVGSRNTDESKQMTNISDVETRKDNDKVFLLNVDKLEKIKDTPKIDEHEDIKFLTSSSDKNKKLKNLEKEHPNDSQNEDGSKRSRDIPHNGTRNEEDKVSSLNVDENKNDLKIESTNILTKEEMKDLLSSQNINDEKTESTTILNKYTKTAAPHVDENKNALKIESTNILTKEDIKDLLSNQNMNDEKTESSIILNKYAKTGAPHVDENMKNPDIREFETIVKFKNQDEVKSINDEQIKSTNKYLPDKNTNLTKVRTENIKSDGNKHRNKKLEEDKKAPKVLSERISPANSDDSNEYLENNQPKEVSNKDIAPKIDNTNTHGELKPKQGLTNGDIIPNDLPFATTATPYEANALKSAQPKITSFNKESDIKLTIKTDGKNTVDINNNTEIKKPCNKTEDCDKKSTVTTETTTDIPKKIKPNVLRSLDTNTRQGSAEHFGDLRPVKEYQVYEIDEKKSAFVKISENVDQPQYFPVYNYEPRNAYYNGENQLGPNILDSEKTDLRENMENHRKGSSEHFGDLQVMKGYEVFESDPSNSPFDVEKRNKNGEQPQYYPVYNYEPQNVYFNAYNRLGPNEDDIDIGDGNTKRNNYFKYNIDQDTAEIESIVFDSGKLTDRRSVSNKNKRYVKQKELQNDNDRFKYISFEEDQPYPLVKKGLKNNLEVTRHILEGIENFEYEIGNVDIEDDFALRADTKNTVWENSYESVREYDVDENSSENEDDDKNDGKVQNLLNDLIELRKKKKKKKLKVQWYPEENKVQIDGVMYDLNDLKLEGQQKGKYINNQMEASRLPVYVFKDPEKMSDKSKERLKGIGDEVYDKTIKHIMDLNDMRPGILNLTDRGKILDTLNKLKKGLINLDRNKTEKQEKYPKDWIAWDPKKNYKNYPMPKMLRSQVQSNSNRVTNLHDTDSESAEDPIKLNTIDEIIHITPEVDMITNLEELLNNNVPIMRSNDEDLEMHVTILKDLVKADNAGLESYDWLGTTVDIQAALTKLIDLVYRRNTLTYIHPSDLQLLKYVEAIFKNARKILLDKEKDLSLVQDIRSNELPKPKKPHINAFKVMNKLYKLRSADSLEEYLVELKNGLEDFHSLIKAISKITTFKNQRWYKNIKELYLVNAGRKEYLEVLLHLISARFFGLLEDSLKKGAEDNFKYYINRNRAEVDRTEVEAMFILRILKAIKELKN